jgi:hypothetical protein
VATIRVGEPSRSRQQATCEVLAIFVPSETQCDVSSICGLHFSLVLVHPGSTRSAFKSAGALRGRMAVTRARDTRTGAIGRSRRNVTGPSACQGRTGCNDFPGPPGVQRRQTNHAETIGTARGSKTIATIATLTPFCIIPDQNGYLLRDDVMVGHGWR